MKISAIIPAYNSASFIPDAVNSILRQTQPVYEIIVVDDGSSDNTADVVKALGHDIIYLRQDNQGPSAARNLGINRARGDWIAFLDADDQWTPEKMEEQLSALKKYPELRLISSDMAEIDNDGKMITPTVLGKHHLLDRFERLDGKPLPNALAELMTKNFIPTGTVLVERQLLLACGLFNSIIRFGEDLELWAKIASRQPITCLPKVHMLRRQHGENATGSTLPMLMDLVKVTRSIRESNAPTLKNQGLDADRLVADALWNLGYWYFQQGDFMNARRTFSDSLNEELTQRGLTYRLASSMPAGLIRKIRQTKKTLTGYRHKDRLPYAD